MRRTYSAKPFLLPILAVSALATLSLVSHYSAKGGLQAGSARLVPRSFAHDFTPDEECRLVHKAKDACAFIKANCPDEEAGVFSYLTLYYCRFPHVKPIGFVILAIWLGLLFTTIGIAASDFLCVNLSTIAKILLMSESFTGVTFLAFGNGSPDVFSTLAAMKSHSGSLAIGELIGAATFISAVVAGSMALIRPFKVAKKSFVRDVGFFIVAVTFSMVFLANGSLEFWECAAMVGFYIFYVITVVIWHWVLGRDRRRRERDRAARAHYVIPEHDSGEAHEQYHDHEDDDEGRSLGGSSQDAPNPISVHDLRNLENQGNDVEGFPNFQDNADDDDDDEARDKLMIELSSNMRLRRPSEGRRRTITPIRPSLVGALEFRALLSHLQKSRNLQPTPINLRRYSEDFHSYAHDTDYEAHSTTTDPEPRSYIGSLADPPPRQGGRARATSVDPSDLRSAYKDVEPQADLLSSSPPQMHFESGKGEPGLAEGSYSGNSDSNPRVSVSPPDSETPTRATSPVGQDSQDRYGDLLAPPDRNMSRSQRKKDAVPQSTEQSTPRLTLTPPGGSYASSRNASPQGYQYHDFPRSTSPTAITGRLPSPSQDVRTYFPHSAEEERTEKPLKWWPYKMLPAPKIFVATLFPTLRSWTDKNWWQRFAAIITAPSIFLLTITVPVVEPQEEQHDEKVTGSLISGAVTPVENFARSVDSYRSLSRRSGNASAANQASNPQNQHQNMPQHERSPLLGEMEIPAPVSTEDTPGNISSKDWNRWLVIIQCFTSPFFIVLNVWANTNPTPKALLLPTLYSLLASFVMLAILLLTTKPAEPPRIRFVFCFLGFAVAITWISAIAGEVVGALKTIGVIFNISDAVLGLTVFAVGNSVGDLVADVTVARLGYPVMALSACFGGPMLNILLGIGIGGLWMTIQGAEKRQHKHPGRARKYKPYEIQVSYTLLISAIALLVTLIGLLIVVPLNKWRMDRRIGWGLISLWVVATIANVIIEVIGWDAEIS